MLFDFVDTDFMFLCYYLAAGFASATFMLITFIAFNEEIKSSVPNSKWAFDDIFTETNEMFRTGTVMAFAIGVECYLLAELYEHLLIDTVDDSKLVMIFCL